MRLPSQERLRPVLVPLRSEQTLPVEVARPPESQEYRWRHYATDRIPGREAAVGEVEICLMRRGAKTESGEAK